MRVQYYKIKKKKAITDGQEIREGHQDTLVESREAYRKKKLTFWASVTHFNELQEFFFI